MSSWNSIALTANRVRASFEAVELVLLSNHTWRRFLTIIHYFTLTSLSIFIYVSRLGNGRHRGSLLLLFPIAK